MFLHAPVELQKANSLYQEKLTAGHIADQTMFKLLWDVEELKTINEKIAGSFMQN